VKRGGGEGEKENCGRQRKVEAGYKDGSREKGRRRETSSAPKIVPRGEARGIPRHVMRNTVQKFLKSTPK
jgi:hypothetical protein